MKLYAYHGVLPEEKSLGQFFFVDGSFWLPISGNQDVEISDSFEKSINYVDIINSIEERFTKNKFDLIESAAEDLCNVIFDKFPKILKVEITVKKPNPPINANFDYISVEISKTR